MIPLLHDLRMIPKEASHILVEDLSSERNTSSDGGTFITISEEGIMKNENISLWINLLISFMK